jgi:hypothetical protein
VDNAEQIFPIGRYSMAPVLKANWIFQVSEKSLVAETHRALFFVDLLRICVFCSAFFSVLETVLAKRRYKKPLLWLAGVFAFLMATNWGQ